MFDITQLEPAFIKYCTTRNHSYTYGTAGFRANASTLDTVMFTTGIVAILRSLVLQGKYIGVMITASHNPPQDNGVKIVEPSGAMLIESWEQIATDLANIASHGNFTAFVMHLSQVIAKLNIDETTTPRLIVGHDSRESSPYLMECLQAAAPVFDTIVINHTLITTPQLHYLTMLQNDVVTEVDYYKFFSTSWNNLFSLYPDLNLTFNNLIVDGANGVGSVQFSKFLPYLPQLATLTTIINDKHNVPQMLNVDCGADFVKTNQKLPNGIVNPNPSDLYASFDGDADRIVFYYVDNNKKFHLLDGDKISTILTKCLISMLRESELLNDINLGVVQTAYANGSSTKYITKSLKVPVECTKTGVKHLHHIAESKFDIGIYFEANGHGTVLFSNKFYEVLQKAIDNGSSSEKIHKARLSLFYFSKLINQTVGDSMADLLAVIATLSILQLSPSDWDTEYQDLPNLLTKCTVLNRFVFKTTDMERKLTSPSGLQEKIDAAVSKYDSGRSFVRASGTEDAVRIYAEAKTKAEVEALSKEVTQLVENS
ncbi:hypothetical protein KAFR_0L00340 [Kazachstania africana CBS 2517]|uniref:Phosphoacetylglucosamine mutase n=1 Tax=Kazachstania africana (strain ATCC 22294 / BCRC 22015 / CBS 2517 / CECT 1963 / NBRC 1671 / NRRL Y-8276) TaxID=1071382 RepID=H2B1Z1_KAZAF|nr:hypothetical protein KAFR_0L00340 [Kazachstania africana CBS 2517]CCF60641.1 hypothetical protein KAFR_0L00340 [Kazachstania africana CBS 2517]